MKYVVWGILTILLTALGACAGVLVGVQFTKSSSTIPTIPMHKRITGTPPTLDESVQFEYLTPSQLDSRTEKTPLIYIPVGSIEWHGEQLPIGNDTIKAHDICCLAAKKSGGVVYPPIYFGVPPTATFGRNHLVEGNVLITEDIFKPLLNTVLSQLEKDGFRAAVVITGHTPIGTQPQIVRALSNHKGPMRVCGVADYDLAKDCEYKGDHAAMWETSLMLYLRPDLVRTDRLPIDGMLESVAGNNPGEYTSYELGKKTSIAIARDLAEIGERLLREAGVPEVHPVISYTVDEESKQAIERLQKFPCRVQCEDWYGEPILMVRLDSMVLLTGAIKPLKILGKKHQLGLSFDEISNEVLWHLKELDIKVLILSRTEVTDAGMEQIAALSNLKYLDVTDTAVTKAGLEKVKGVKLVELVH